MRNYKPHIKQRFKQKFKDLNACRVIDLKYLTNTNIDEITEMALTQDGYLTCQGNRHTIKKVIFYYGVAMWCVIDPKKRTLRTIYPIKKKENKILLKLTNKK